jgi:hypothetical protein
MGTLRAGRCSSSRCRLKMGISRHASARLSHDASTLAAHRLLLEVLGSSVHHLEQSTALPRLSHIRSDGSREGLHPAVPQKHGKLLGHNVSAPSTRSVQCATLFADYKAGRLYYFDPIPRPLGKQNLLARPVLSQRLIPARNFDHHIQQQTTDPGPSYSQNLPETPCQTTFTASRRNTIHIGDMLWREETGFAPRGTIKLHIFQTWMKTVQSVSQNGRAKNREISPTVNLPTVGTEASSVPWPWSAIDNGWPPTAGYMMVMLTRWS